MIKILTAIGNPEIVENLEKEEYLEINYKDIQYKEGILEILEKNNKINLIIINEKIPGKIEINLLLENILKINPKIKIYLIIKNKKLEIKNNNIYIFNEININLLKQKIKEELEISKNKENKIIEEKENKNIEIKNIDQEIYKDISKFILVLGHETIEKSAIVVILSFLISQQKNKVLLVERDIKNENISTIFQEKKNINKIQKIEENYDFICTENSIKNIEKNYDLIFIDNYNKNKLNKNHKIIFISEGNLIGIEKSKKILNKLNIIKNKNNILLINNYNKNSIDLKILKNIFFEFNNIEKIKYSEKYNLIINNFNKINLYLFLNKKYKKIIKKIIN